MSVVVPLNYLNIQQKREREKFLCVGSALDIIIVVVIVVRLTMALTAMM